jgi:drug/metabolite transporter (DMT)-like permease
MSIDPPAPSTVAATPQRARERAWAGPLMMAGGAVCIGFAPIGLRLSEFGPQATAFWRFAFALPLLALIVVAMGGRIRRPSPFALLAGLFFGLDMALWHLSLTKTSVANATFLVNLGNASVGLIAWLLLRERPARAWFIALAIALAGALLLSRGAEGAEDAQSRLEGDLLALAAAGMVAFYLLFAQLARRTLDALNVMWWATLATLAVSLAATLLAGERLVPLEPSWLIIPAILAAVAHVAGQGLIVAGMGRTPVAIGGLLLLLQPVAAAAIAWPLFGEALEPAQALGAGLILLGVWLAGRRQVDRPKTTR